RLERPRRAGRGHEQVLPQQVGQGGDADAETALPEEMPAGDALEKLAGVLVPHVRHSLVSVSSRLSSTLATIVQAASSAASPGAAGGGARAGRYRTPGWGRRTP